MCSTSSRSPSGQDKLCKAIEIFKEADRGLVPFFPLTNNKYMTPKHSSKQHPGYFSVSNLLENQIILHLTAWKYVL